MTDIDFIRHFQLRAITMIHCAVERGGGRVDGSVSMSTEAGMHPHRDGSELTYFVDLEYKAADEEQEMLISGSVQFAVTYSLTEGFVPSEDQLEHYGFGGVAFQVHPYLREHVTSMCTRAGLPPYALPILGRDEGTPRMEHPA